MKDDAIKALHSQLSRSAIGCSTQAQLDAVHDFMHEYQTYTNCLEFGHAAQARKVWLRVRPLAAQVNNLISNGAIDLAEGDS